MKRNRGEEERKRRVYCERVSEMNQKRKRKGEEKSSGMASAAPRLTPVYSAVLIGGFRVHNERDDKAVETKHFGENEHQHHGHKHLATIV